MSKNLPFEIIIGESRNSLSVTLGSRRVLAGMYNHRHSNDDASPNASTLAHGTTTLHQLTQSTQCHNLRDLIDHFAGSKADGSRQLIIAHRAGEDEFHYYTDGEAVADGHDAVFTFDLNKPFEEQFPVESIRTVHSFQGILEAFKKLQPEHYSANPNYSPKIELVFDLFQQEKAKQNRDYLYVLLTEEGEVKSIIPSVFFSSLCDFNTQHQRICPNETIIMALNLHEDFGEQIRSGNFDPETLTSWDPVIEKPLDFIKPVGLLEKHTNVAPVTLGPERPVLAWQNPNPKP